MTTKTKIVQLSHLLIYLKIRIYLKIWSTLSARNMLTTALSRQTNVSSRHCLDTTPLSKCPLDNPKCRLDNV